MGAKLDDTVITSKVKAALLDDKDVKSGQINVETRAGTVSLGGFVSGEKVKTRAVAVAKGVSGVKNVVDAMYVKPN
jgi:osmotically-inducible protein OsmY